MEQKKFDINSFIGFVLIGLILLWMISRNAPDQQEVVETTPQTNEQVVQEDPIENLQQVDTTVAAMESMEGVADSIVAKYLDSLRLENLRNRYGSLAVSQIQAEATTTTIENDVLLLKVNTQGGYPEEVVLKQFKTHDSIPIYLIKDGNSTFNLQFSSENRILNTRDLLFTPEVYKTGDTTVLSMKLKSTGDNYLEYRYALKPGEYMIDFAIQSQGMSPLFNTSQQPELEWQLKTYRKSKSVSYENRYTEVIYEYENGKDDYLGQRKSTNTEASEVTYIAYKQHHFSSILLTDTPFKKARMESYNLVEDETIDTVYTKNFVSKIPLEYQSGELSYTMDWYFGPTDYRILNPYDRNLGEVVSLGWGIFGWINKYLFTPLFSFLSSWLPNYGWVIILMTILVKIALSPVQYKQYLSQAKMKILRPEIEEINKKYKDNAMKRQQETMALYNKAGANPMAGCLPALMQLPVFYALFMFFPSAFQLRHEGFLWADDLSSYDSIAELSFHIPFYGSHVSLFPILASIAIFIYMMMTMGQTQMPQQPGMPNMKFIMYISPIFMLFFFNNYASGLSLYFFISNLITIGIMLVIKHFVIDEKKILANIEYKKQQPKKQSRFQRKMQELMEQAEKQKQARENQRKK